jgi:hypothetical protein
MRHSARPEEPSTWVVARRYCSAGCVLLANDLEPDASLGDPGDLAVEE